MVWNTYASRSAYFLRLLVEASKQSSQHGVYEKAQGVQNYAAFAPPANGGQELREMSPR